MDKYFIRLSDGFIFPISVNDNNVTAKQRSIPIDISKNSPTEYYLNLFWAENKESPLVHIGKFKLNLLGLAKKGYVRIESKNVIRLIMVCERNGEIYLRLNKSDPQILLGNINSQSVMIANISFNIFSWKGPYINPNAGHCYTTLYPGHESLNFKFDKKGIDTHEHIHGNFQWTDAPKKFKNGGTIIFYTKNTSENIGQIVGIYGNVTMLDNPIMLSWKGFERDEIGFSIKADRDKSLLFPISLDAEKYKISKSKRLVGQAGFSYFDNNMAERIIKDELLELSKSGLVESEFLKLKSLYSFVTGVSFDESVLSSDLREQEELSDLLSNERSKIIYDLTNLKENDSEVVVIKQKAYKRDNKTLAQLKILRNFECQICSGKILKANGSYYIEAAHITPKRLKGRETPENILILCPNHHKEFDHGKREILEHSGNSITFKLNGKKYDISLKLE